MKSDKTEQTDNTEKLENAEKIASTGIKKILSPSLLISCALFIAAAIFGTTLPTWISAEVHAGVKDSLVKVAGSQAAPAVSSLGLVILITPLAVRLASSKIRLAMCIVMFLASIGIIISTYSVLQYPESAAKTAIGNATGLSAVQADYSLGIWPWLAIGLALIAALLSVALGITSRHWMSRRKYERASTVSHADAEEKLDEVDTWDSLSNGVDPTQ